MAFPCYGVSPPEACWSPRRDRSFHLTALVRGKLTRMHGHPVDTRYLTIYTPDLTQNTPNQQVNLYLSIRINKVLQQSVKR